MKIVFGIRQDYLTNRGGDTFQLLKTKEYLEQYSDISVDIISTPDELHGEIDVLHIFNMQNIHFANAMIMEAKRREIKVVLSPVVWRFGHAQYVNKVMRLTHSMNMVHAFKPAHILFELVSIYNHKRQKQSILQNCDMVLPNSNEEGEILKEQYKTGFNEMIVPNCIDLNLSEEKQVISTPKDFILQVGRIEPTKNQLSLLQAMMEDRDIPVVFIGKQNKRKSFYIKQLKKLAEIRGNTFFIEELSQTQLAQYYKAAKVHVLPSFRESPGLVTLEALYYGCNIVVSNEKFCPIHYYRFDELGYICDPYSVESIKEAVISAYNAKPVCVDKEYYDSISYKKAAEITRKAYLKVLGQA